MTAALILLDTALNALMLLMAARFAGYRVRPLRTGLGALAGALAAQAARTLRLTRGQTALLWLPLAAAMMGAACGRRAWRRPLRSAALLLCAAGLLGGVVLSLEGATGSLPAAYALGCACAAGLAAAGMRARHAARDVVRVRVTCRFRGQTAVFEAMVDSGNTLRDYLTHRPVIVLAHASGRRRFALGTAPLRPIFADTAGGRRMMDCFVPEETIVEWAGGRRSVRAAVALSPYMREGVPALLPASLLSGEMDSD